MRLIGTFIENGESKSAAFSYFLASCGIENQVEAVSSAFNQPTHYKIWVANEDQIERAEKLFDEFNANPTDPRYSHLPRPEELPIEEEQEKTTTSSSRSFKPVTLLVLFSVVLIFLWSHIGTNRMMPPPIKGVIEAPVLSPVEQALLYDYPTYFQLRDELLTLWPAAKIKEKSPPPPEAMAVLQKLQQTTVWVGIYDRIIKHGKNPLFPLRSDAPLFERIKEGEVWRSVSPILLHFDLLHIFFNVLWFIILSNQIEARIGSFRTLIFILSSALFSNTGQYLMSGPFFMGLSGVICAMAAFIWARQQKAPWEGYLLQRITLLFLAIFVLGMFLLSFVLFILQYFQGISINIVIANTAHLVGALMGYLLGRTSFFAVKFK